MAKITDRRRADQVLQAQFLQGRFLHFRDRDLDQHLLLRPQAHHVEDLLIVGHETARDAARLARLPVQNLPCRSAPASHRRPQP